MPNNGQDDIQEHNKLKMAQFDALYLMLQLNLRLSRIELSEIVLFYYSISLYKLKWLMLKHSLRSSL
jgi:hypothetical protein